MERSSSGSILEAKASQQEGFESQDQFDMISPRFIGWICLPEFVTRLMWLPVQFDLAMTDTECVGIVAPNVAFEAKNTLFVVFLSSCLYY